VLRELAKLIALGHTASDQVASTFMITYLSYCSTNYRTPSERTYPDLLAAEYRDLQELRDVNVASRLLRRVAAL
jgi:hypothetical protein